MDSETRHVAGHSPVAGLMEQFVQEKQACGYRYTVGIGILRRFDTFLCEQGLDRCELPRTLSRQWLSKRSHESAGTQGGRIAVVRQFALFMGRLGHRADIPDRTLGAKRTHGYSPRILTHAEVGQLFEAVDRLKPTARAPLRHLVMPEVLRLLYGCGFRVNEVLRLRVGDVDLGHGVLTVRAAKFAKDRLVPPALPLVQRLQRYAAGFGPRPADTFFFASPNGAAWRAASVYWEFRALLHRCRIFHGGRGRGPRIHDLRHTFAVHTLIRWHREGADLDAKLPVLATYLGHTSLEGTQQYLHLTAELFPEVVIRASNAFGDVIPRRRRS